MITTSGVRAFFTPNGVSTSFPFGFFVGHADDLVVTLYGADGATIALPSYNVSGVGSEQGGSVVFATPPVAVANAVGVIERRTVQTSVGAKPKDFIQEAAAERERRQDQGLALAQEAYANQLRSIRQHRRDATGNFELPPTAMRVNRLLGFDGQGNPASFGDRTAFDGNLPAAASRAGKIFGWDSNGNATALNNVPLSPTVPVGAFWQDALLGGTRHAANAALGNPITPAPPDTMRGLLSVTTVVGDPAVVIAGAAFTPADVGKLIMVGGAGPIEGRLVTAIAAVINGTTVELDDAPTQAMENVYQWCFWGSDQYENLQETFDYGQQHNLRVYVPAGTYLTSQGLVCLPPAGHNRSDASPPLCWLDPGATIVAMAPMQSILTYGSPASDYSGIVRKAYFGGGVLDGNFLADYGANIPFSLEATRAQQMTKNTRRAGVRWGNMASPHASAGGLDFNINHSRDISYVRVTNITNANPAEVTTEWDHGFATGRVIGLVNVAGMTEATRLYYRVTTTGPRSFQLDDTDSTGWGTFTGTALAALTMPAMQVPIVIWAISNANPGVVTLAKPHHLSTGQKVWLADMLGINLGGIYTATVTGPTTLSIGVDTTSLGAYTGGGRLHFWTEPEDAEKGIYYENATDMDMIGGQLVGTRWSMYANPATCGHDGKVFKPHIFNYFEQGDVFCGIGLVGSNELIGCQFDGKIRYGARFTGLVNAMVGCRLNNANVAVYNNYACFVRLDGAGEVTVIGGGIKGDTSLAVYAEVSRNGMVYGNVPGYTRLGLSTAYVSLKQPDTLTDGYLNVNNQFGAAVMRAIGFGAAMTVIDRAPGRGGLLVQTSTGSKSTTFATVDENGVVDSVVLTLTGNATVIGDGTVFRLGNQYQAGAPAATGYVTIEDKLGNSLKVLVAD